MTAPVMEKHLEDKVKFTLHRPGMMVGVEKRPESLTSQLVVECRQQWPIPINPYPIILLAQPGIISPVIRVWDHELLNQLSKEFLDRKVTGPSSQLVLGVLIISQGSA